MAVGLDPRIGTELAGYRLESVVGRGGMGVVYLAQDLRLDRRVALKLISPELAADPRFRERFLREARLAASFDHSHVVPVHAAGETGGELWIAMRFVEGEDLATLLGREGPLEPVRALELCSQVGEALDAAHERGLVHRDVKPANVLVTEEGGREHCYLTDFGLARDADVDPGAPTHLSGTVDYTAPEQIAHEPADGRADVYSLGCVLYECLTGEPPFTRPRAMATLFAHASEEPPSLHEARPELPRAIDGVIAKALAKEPDERYRSCAELVGDARVGLGLGKGRLSRGRLLALGAGAALVLGAAVAIPTILIGSRDDAPAAAEPILPVTTDSLVRLDPRTGEAVAALEVGSRPVGVAAGEGSVWVISTGNKRLSRIDPATNAAVRALELEHSPSRVAAGEGAVWIATNPDAAPAEGVLRYAPGSDSVSAVPGIFSPGDIAAGQGGVWVAGSASSANAGTEGPGVFANPYRTFLRLDAATGAIMASVSWESPLWTAVGDLALRVAVGEGGVWAATWAGQIASIDAATNSAIRTREIGEGLAGIAAGEGAVWALKSDNDSVFRVDPVTLRVTDTVRVGRAPTALAAGGGAVWVTSERDGTVTRIDSTTFDVETIDVGGQATDVAVGLGGVWVTVDVR